MLLPLLSLLLAGQLHARSTAAPGTAAPGTAAPGTAAPGTAAPGRLRGKSDISPFIVGGDDAEPGQFPELVSIQYANQHLCGGFIIDKLWLLTAAHCLYQVDPESLTVLAGTTDIAQPGPDAVRAKVYGYLIHEDYDADEGVFLGHDIALVKLEEPLVFTPLVQPASLQNVSPNAGDLVSVAGWGQTENADPPVASSKLEWTALGVVARDQCQDALQGFAELQDDQICAQSAAAGVHAECKGDSGGALFAEGLVVGIVSWSRKPCGSYPGVFTSIPENYGWIRDKSGLEDL